MKRSKRSSRSQLKSGYSKKRKKTMNLKSSFDEDRCWVKTIYILLIYFVILTIFFYIYQFNGVLQVLALSALAFFLLKASELRMSVEKRRFVSALKHALFVGFFLVVFASVVHCIGSFLGLWMISNSFLMVFGIPIECLLLCFFGAAGWAINMPKKINKIVLLIDLVFFSFFATLGMKLLILNGTIRHFKWWNLNITFISYVITWIILYFVLQMLRNRKVMFWR